MTIEEVLKMKTWGQKEVAFLSQRAHLLDAKTRQKMGIGETVEEKVVEKKAVEKKTTKKK